MVSLRLATEQSLALTPGRVSFFWAVCTGTRPGGHVHRDMTPIIRCIRAVVSTKTLLLHLVRTTTTTTTPSHPLTPHTHTPTTTTTRLELLGLMLSVSGQLVRMCLLANVSFLVLLSLLGKL